MKTITTCVHDIIRHQPFLDDAIARDIVNFSGLAEDLRPEVEKEMRKPVKVGSIIMALRRYAPKRTKINMNSLRELGDIIVRSGITEYTFLNSKTIIANKSRLLDAVKDQTGVYLNYSSNYQESNILVSSSLTNLVEDYFKNEVRVTIKEDLSSITIALPKNSSQSVGLYFYIFKLLAYEGIPVFEMISTSNYFALFLEREYVNKAFLLLNEIKTN
ncbi:MAG: hypothetical protein CMP12_11100 [Zunongwangia sp.]|uniref:Aspartate kinase n=2 Tax=Zunongwangia profunda TaxID=398743 RepID=D5BEE0_ZUNPS|nr:hypothetical protein [Zunongwangia profunda]MAC65477.1 hypothetical protein [Flavobacteriaceae bacterium]MAO36432.1 hypothetical protein [Zunongwangia sp.]ADF52899.1 conserved hypothetical protein [Zunongwangia profunda SM-A87]MAG86348.1 hypothetical protein [Flavobacteriaceae bacterium]MAS72755.1 hypothetical protein [Zunongwangia sp.]|tara:strand:+ start:436 stop:1083 length:648 start_codon:yes stop_codon:yes gene_type:complete